METLYDSIQPYVKRLTKEWTEHKKIIIACDYDDTIFPWGQSIDHKLVVDILMRAKTVGAYIVIWTASAPSRYEEIRDYCRKIGLEIDGINENVIDLPYGNGKKIYANIYVDDRAGLNESLKILSVSTSQVKNLNFQ